MLDPDLLASPMTRTPTETEISEILEPWRPQKLRRIAAAHLHLEPFKFSDWPHFYLLRTYYDGGAEDDAKLRRWLDELLSIHYDIEPEHEWFAVLDDAELFDVYDWPEVYDILPELAAPRPDRRFTLQDVEWAREWAKELIKSDYMKYETEDEHYAEAIREHLAGYSGPWLVVLDRESFEKDDLGLMFRDKKGRSVKEAEIRPEDLNDFRCSSDRGRTHEGWWEHAYVPKRYRVNGKRMRPLLSLVKGEAGEGSGA